MQTKVSRRRRPNSANPRIHYHEPTAYDNAATIMSAAASFVKKGYNYVYDYVYNLEVPRRGRQKNKVLPALSDGELGDEDDPEFIQNDPTPNMYEKSGSRMLETVKEDLSSESSADFKTAYMVSKSRVR